MARFSDLRSDYPLILALFECVRGGAWKHSFEVTGSRISRAPILSVIADKSRLIRKWVPSSPSCALTTVELAAALCPEYVSTDPGNAGHSRVQNLVGGMDHPRPCASSLNLATLNLGTWRRSSRLLHGRICLCCPGCLSGECRGARQSDLVRYWSNRSWRQLDKTKSALRLPGHGQSWPASGATNQ